MHAFRLRARGGVREFTRCVQPQEIARPGAQRQIPFVVALARGLQGEDSLILVAGDDVYIRSDAVIRATAALGGPWTLFKAALLVPKPLRDTAYRAIAKLRRRFSPEACATGPGTDELRARTIG